uniref:No apical meristem-associated C-terminal domain-containing protein n=1 Tax=Brassica oleracea var. oleracea TaxID=109376 RepID=A0A0D3BW23_BRAOL
MIRGIKLDSKSMYIELGFATREAILVARAIERSFVHKIEEVVSLDRSQMDPAEEIRHSKKQRDYCNMLWFVQDSQYGIPRRCACGGKIIDKVRGKEDYDSHPGKRYFTCINYEEEIERLRKRLEDVEEEIKGVWNLKFQIQTMQEQVRSLTVQVGTLEKDPIVSNEQKVTSFWKRIEAYVNCSPLLTGCVLREWSQCKQRWGRVNEQVCKFVGSYEAAMKHQSSGQNEDDVMKAAHEIFFNDYQAKFTMEHCWRELRHDQKWKSVFKSRDGAKEKRKETEEVIPEDEVRPLGVKASKAAKRKRHGHEAAFDQIESILAERKKISQ